MRLHGFFRSSAAYRVRIALNLKGVSYSQSSYRLRNGEQRSPAFLALNPQGLVPALELDDGTILTQSLAMIEWLDETYSAPPLLPKDPLRRARVRAFAYAIACDTHPVQNLRVLNRVAALAGEDAQKNWAAEVNAEGLHACEQLLADEAGPFCFGPEPTLADICLVPQLANARRYKADIGSLRRLLEADAAARALPAFVDAEPDRQPDAE